MNNPVIFYHLWPTGEWKEVNKNIFRKIVDSGLSKKMEKMFICVNTDIPFSEIDLHGIDSDRVEFVRTENTQSEWTTLQILYDNYVKVDNTPVLYMHCKGARFTQKNHSYYAIRSWVDGMTYFNVTRWKKCIAYLESGKASVGIRVARMPVPHYSGNFWWVNSSSLKLLLDPRTQDKGFTNRHGAEFWIGRLGMNNLFDTDFKRHIFTYNQVVDPKSYVENDIFEKGICVHRVGNHDTSWVNRLNFEYSIYQFGSNLVTESRTEAYIRYIYDNYEDLPKYVFFLSSLAMVNIFNLTQLLKNSYNKFQPFGRDRFRDNYQGLPNHPNLPLKDTWEQFFSNQCPEYFEFTANPNFGVSKGEILKYSRSFYKKILSAIESGTNPQVDYCFERMWERMFTCNNSENISNDQQLPQLFNSEIIDVSIFSVSSGIKKYSDVNITSLGNDVSEYWNNIITNINNSRLLFISDNVNYNELKVLVESNFKLNNRVESEYLEFNFNNWRAIVVESEILIKNKNKKKKFIEPFIDNLSQKLLHLSNGI